jgi:DNA-binding phage protein
MDIKTLKQVKEVLNIAAIAREVDLPSQTLYTWMRRDKELGVYGRKIERVLKRHGITVNGVPKKTPRKRD